MFDFDTTKTFLKRESLEEGSVQQTPQGTKQFLLDSPVFAVKTQHTKGINSVRQARDATECESSPHLL